MCPDDAVIVDRLDDKWRTVPAVHRLLGGHGRANHLGDALKRLAGAGRIEKREKATGIPKRGHSTRAIEFYRRLQA